MVGQAFEVLVDAFYERRGQWAGRTTSNRIINFPSTAPNLLGQYLPVKIVRGGPNSLAGEYVG